MSECAFPAGVQLVPAPLMNRGKWDRPVVILPNGEKATGHFEATRGRYVFFEAGKRWRKFYATRFASADGFDLRG